MMGAESTSYYASGLRFSASAAASAASDSSSPLAVAASPSSSHAAASSGHKADARAHRRFHPSRQARDVRVLGRPMPRRAARTAGCRSFSLLFMTARRRVGGRPLSFAGAVNGIAAAAVVSASMNPAGAQAPLCRQRERRRNRHLPTTRPP